MKDFTKNQLRFSLKQERKLLDNVYKKQLDNKVYENVLKFINLNEYRLVLSYISTEIEVDTRKIINYCHENNIDIAVPKCVGNRNLRFFYCNKNSILKKSLYGIYEPVPEKNIPASDFKNALCIVPGLSFDKQGYRLGYGGGFYDKFINDNPDVVTVGICYSQNMADKLPSEIHDRHIDYVITDKTMEVCNE